MADEESELEALGPVLSDLEEASKLPSRQRGDVRPTLEKAAGLLYDTGVLPEDLIRIIDLVTVKSHLNQNAQTVLVRNMYPTGYVPGTVVLKIIGCLGEGQRKPPAAVQILLLKWLIMVYHVLEKSDILSQAYSILFNLLGNIDLRPHLCQILSLITRRKHVKPHRVQNIFALCENEDRDPSLVALLRIFKNCYPEIALGGPARGPAATFKYPNHEWRARLEEIQRNHRSKGVGHIERPHNGFLVRKEVGRTSKGVLPLVHTLQLQKDSVALEEIYDAEGLVQNLEKIELPNQLVAVLGDPLLQKLLRLRPDNEAARRVSNWVTSCIQDVASGDADPRLLLDMVDTIYQFVRGTKSLPPIFFQLFNELFKVWDGKERSSLVLDILSFAPLMDFDELYSTILEAMEHAVLDNTARSQLLLLKFYKSLLQRWHICMSSAEDVSSLPTKAISSLLHHTSQLALTLSQTSPTTSASLAILDFYECAVSLFQDTALLPHLEISLPPPLLVYLLHFSPFLVTVSRLYSLVTAYKKALSTAAKGRGFTASEKRLVVPVVNGFLTDIVDCIWRGHAFANTDKAARGCFVPRDILPALEIYLERIELGVRVPALFGFSHSPVFCLQSSLYIQRLEDEELASSNLELHRRQAGPVTKASLVRLAADGGLELSFRNYRAGVLKHLEEGGFSGPGELMYSSMPRTFGRAGSLFQEEGSSQLQQSSYTGA